MIFADVVTAILIQQVEGDGNGGDQAEMAICGNRASRSVVEADVSNSMDD